MIYASHVFARFAFHNRDLISCGASSLERVRADPWPRLFACRKTQDPKWKWFLRNLVEVSYSHTHNSATNRQPENY